jgi:hypothetical protein
MVDFHNIHVPVAVDSVAGRTADADAGFRSSWLVAGQEAAGGHNDDLPAEGPSRVHLVGEVEDSVGEVAVDQQLHREVEGVSLLVAEATLRPMMLVVWVAHCWLQVELLLPSFHPTQP